MANANGPGPNEQSDGKALPGDSAGGTGAPTVLSRLKGSWRLVLPLLCLFQFSLLVSWLLLSRFGESEPIDEAQAAAKVLPKAENDKPVDPAPPDAEKPDPRVGENHLRDGNYALALPHFSPSEADAKAAATDATQFRAGLCLEGLGRWDDALTAYRAALAKTTNPRMIAAAQVAQARVWLRKNQTSQTKALLYPILLQAGRPGRYVGALMAEVRYLLGMALSREAFGDQRLETLDETLVRADFADWPIARSLEWIAPSSEAKEAAKDLPGAVEIFQPYGPRSEEVLVRGSVAEMPVALLAEKLGALGKLQVHWSLAAWQRVDGRIAQLAIESAPLLDVVQAIIEPYGLVCQVKDSDLSLATAAETPKEALATYRAAAARQALRAAVFGDPDHYLAAAAYLELGNDEAVLNKFDQAVAWYERLIADTGHSPQVTPAYFNLGLVQRARNECVAARKAFYRVVDRNPGHELALRAFVQIGWTLVMEGQPLEAIFPLDQATSSAAAGPAHSEAVIALGAAQLLSGNPREANSVLTAGRQYVSQEPWRTTAAFLDALARFRSTAATKTARTESADLLAAALAFQGRPALGALGRLLTGQAYQELGMLPQMAKVYDEAIPRIGPGPMAEEMSCSLAEYLYNVGQREPALKLLTSVAARQQGKWAGVARLRLASFALKEGRPQECVAACAALLANGGAVDRPAVLQLMGAAFEQLGEYEKAARCYAGQLPD